MRRLLIFSVVATSLIPTSTALADHNRDCDWEGNCGSQEYRHDYSNHDRNRNRDRDRGAFSPGPFDDSPVDAFNGICMPGATCYYDRDPNQQEPRPSPGSSPQDHQSF